MPLPNHKTLTMNLTTLLKFCWIDIALDYDNVHGLRQGHKNGQDGEATGLLEKLNAADPALKLNIEK